MKKRLAIILVMALCMSLMAVPVMAATPQVTVILDGKQLTFTDVAPVVEEGRTLVPLRAIFEAMGAKVDWNQDAKTATAVKGDTTVVLKLDDVSPTINGEVKKIDVPAKVVNNRTLAPLRFVGEAFGGTVEWDQATYTVKIAMAAVTPAPGPAPAPEPAAPATAADLAKAVVGSFAPVNANISLTGTVAGIVKVGAEATATIGKDGVASAKIKGDAGPLGKSEVTAALCPYSEVVFGPEAEALKVVSAAALKDNVITVSGNLPASFVEFLNNVNKAVTWSEVTGDAEITVDKNHVAKIVVKNGKAKAKTPIGDKEAVFEATFTYTY